MPVYLYARMTYACTSVIMSAVVYVYVCRSRSESKDRWAYKHVCEQYHRARTHTPHTSYAHAHDTREIHTLIA